MRPTKDAIHMQEAEVFAQLSTCQRGQVGVVITVDGRTVSTGYNGAPKGIEHCDHFCSCWSDVLGAELRGDVGVEHAAICEMHPDNACWNAVHGEANAIAFAAKYGVRLEGAVLYTTLSPCLRCAQLIINAGIVRVVSGQPYRDKEGMRLLVRAGIQLT